MRYVRADGCLTVVFLVCMVILKCIELLQNGHTEVPTTCTIQDMSTGYSRIWLIRKIPSEPDIEVKLPSETSRSPILRSRP